MKRLLGILFFSLSIPVAGLAGEPSFPNAAESRDTQLVKRLFKNGADVNAEQVDGMTALHWAAYHDNAALAAAVKKRANASVKNRYGITPLHFACLNGNAQLIGALIERRADPDDSINGGETALMTAARTGKLEAVKVLLRAGAGRRR